MAGGALASNLRGRNPFVAGEQAAIPPGTRAIERAATKDILVEKAQEGPGRQGVTQALQGAPARESRTGDELAKGLSSGLGSRQELRGFGPCVAFVAL